MSWRAKEHVSLPSLLSWAERPSQSLIMEICTCSAYLWVAGFCSLPVLGLIQTSSSHPLGRGEPPHPLVTTKPGSGSLCLFTLLPSATPAHPAGAVSSFPRLCVCVTTKPLLQSSGPCCASCVWHLHNSWVGIPPLPGGGDWNTTYDLPLLRRHPIIPRALGYSIIGMEEIKLKTHLH